MTLGKREIACDHLSGEGGGEGEWAAPLPRGAAGRASGSTTHCRGLFLSSTLPRVVFSVKLMVSWSPSASWAVNVTLLSTKPGSLCANTRVPIVCQRSISSSRLSKALGSALSFAVCELEAKK